jgi:hypothetical protein
MKGPCFYDKVGLNNTTYEGPLQNGFAACEPFSFGYAKRSMHLSING